ncbi:MAG: SDR family NAD(P)-dependent oxidoreductase [Clostridia bacterium]|nr:SDR family NAD(P)-dependent oxidoreductase [Clostridia bacterium]
MKEKRMERGWNLVTGATGGLGGAFVQVLAERNEPLFLTGRSEEKLANLKAQLQEKYPELLVEYTACDLTDSEDRTRLVSALRTACERYGVSLKRLINVAGADIQKPLTEYTEQKLLFQCRVNFESAVSLARSSIEQGVKEIINISSVSGIYPMPYFAIYSATKGALTSFSLSLREEMRGAGVKVTAILPGAIPTRDDVKEQIKGQGLWGKIAAKPPRFVAEKSLLAVSKNKGKVVVGFANKLMNFGTKLIPLPIKLKFIAGRWSKIRKDSF